jgi:hypothetical protein
MIRMLTATYGESVISHAGLSQVGAPVGPIAEGDHEHRAADASAR